MGSGHWSSAHSRAERRTEDLRGSPEARASSWSADGGRCRAQGERTIWDSAEGVMGVVSH